MNLAKRKLVLLDLGGVVFQSFGKSNNEIKWDAISKLNRRYGADLDIGEDLFGNFIDDYNKLTDQQLQGSEFLEKVFDTLDFNKVLVDHLTKDRDIVIVSDNYRENIEYISERYDFASWSIRQVYSYDYKMFKSNPDFFKRLLEELTPYSVEDMIFIDDSLSKLDSAAKHHIKGFRYLNNDQIIEDLKEFS